MGTASPGAGTARRGRRAGASAAEALVALLLGLFVVHLGLAALVRLRAAEGRLAIRSDALVAMRVARHVLRRELGHGVPSEDWEIDGDSISLRAFRGTALLCGNDTTSVEIIVSYVGDRSPDPTKDSVLLIDPTGGRTVRALVGVGSAPAACGSRAAEVPLRWTLDAPVAPGPVVGRIFERGSYHVAASALRYQRGGSGRQPLTPEVWSDSTRWSASGGRVWLEVLHRKAEAGPPWAASLVWTESP